MAENQNINSSKILLHACCAICSGYPIELLQSMGYSVVIYFYNPNIYPAEEYQLRLEAQKTLCRHFETDLIVEEYNPEEYYDYIQGLEREPEKGTRCDKCFELRLDRTARKARELGIEEFTTSIVISPHKNFEKITQIGNSIAQKYELKYLPINFRKQDGFLKTNNIAKKLNLYRQKYCGCQFAQKIL